MVSDVKSLIKDWSNHSIKEEEISETKINSSTLQSQTLIQNSMSIVNKNQNEEHLLSKGTVTESTKKKVENSSLNNQSMDIPD